MWRAQDREPIDFAAIDILAKNETCLDRLPDTYIVGDKKSGGLLTERHHKWRQLIGTWLKVDFARPSERPRTTPQ
jgi:hypothetical protein